LRASSARTRFAPTNPDAPVTNAVGSSYLRLKSKGRSRTRSTSQRNE
jgi:hypothetical protein